jgi:hypothetical protein
MSLNANLLLGLNRALVSGIKVKSEHEVIKKFQTVEEFILKIPIQSDTTGRDLNLLILLFPIRSPSVFGKIVKYLA